MLSPQRLVWTGMAALAATGAGAGRADAGAPRPAKPRHGLELSYNIAVMSDYRRGGLSRSGGKPAVQGGVDINGPDGWSAGASVSTIEKRRGATSEVEVFAAKRIKVGANEFAVGATAVVFPGGDDSDFGFAQASVSRAIGPVDATLSVKYAWEQPNLGDEDDTIVSLRVRTPVGRLVGIPITMGASVARTEGRFAIEGTKVDWSWSLTADVKGVDVGVTYSDTDLEDKRGDPAWALSMVRNF